MIVEFIKETPTLRNNGKTYKKGERLVVDKPIGLVWVADGSAKEVERLFDEIIIETEKPKRKKKN